MRDLNLFLCHGLWPKAVDDRQLWELLGNLRSPNPEVRDAAQACLVEAGPRSIQLLQVAVASGVLPGTIAVESVFIVCECHSGEYRSDGIAPAALTYDC